MSITRLTSGLAALVTTLALAITGQAQLFKPFAFPPVESDFQFFAPADVDTYGGGPTEKTGWFADYDRVYMNVQRPDDAYILSDKMGDFTWGNRFEIGYVDDDMHGWLFTGWHIDGPNENVIYAAERINRWMSTGAPEEAPIFPIRDNNLRLTGGRDYLITNSVNVADMTGVELNRTWQLDQLHYGARLTPFVGLRYVKFIDFYQRDTYLRYDDAGFIVPPIPPALALTATTEQLVSLQAGVQNDMLGGQLGAHWDRDYRRWNFSGDFKAFALQNFQNWNEVTKTVTSIYPGELPQQDTIPDTVLEIQDGSADHNAEFVFGMELRFDAAYRLTRDISLRGGAEFIDFGQGIGRGIDRENNNQDVIMYGFTMGVTWNR
ncbi:MAG: hypothetical protein ACYC6N_19765 [Pirellulaceae bacterium]